MRTASAASGLRAAISARISATPPGPARASPCGRCRSPRSARRRSPPSPAARRRPSARSASIWRVSTSSVSSASRCASLSPTQRIGSRPASRAAGTLRASASSVSPKYCRRSEWPSTTALDAQLDQHRRGDLAGEGSARLLVHVLGGDPDGGPSQASDGRAERGEGRADDDVGVHARELREEVPEERLGLVDRLVHLPVGGEVAAYASAAPPPRAAPCPRPAPARRRHRSRASRPHRRGRTRRSRRRSRRRRPR